MFQDFYTKLNDQEKKILYIAIAVVLLMGLDRLFLGPVLSKINSFDEEIEQQKKIAQRDLRFLSYKGRILNENSTLSMYYKNDSETVEEVIASFLKNLEMMATETNVDLIKVTPADSKERKGYLEYFANLECEGLLENIVNFMYAIDTSDDLLKISKINMTLKRASGDEVLVAMVVAKMIVDPSFGSVQFAQEKKDEPLPLKVKRKKRSSSSSKDNQDQDSSSGGSGESGAGSDDESGGGDESVGASGAVNLNTAGDDSDDTLEMSEDLSSSNVQGEEVSARFMMKGFKSSKKDLEKQKKRRKAEQEEPAIQKSIFEKIMEKAEKDAGGE